MDSSQKSAAFISDDPRFKITPYQQMAAACTGGILSSFLITPLDVIKVRLQAQQRSSGVVHKCYLYCNGLPNHYCPCLYPRPKPFSGSFDATLKIARFEGITSLWSGLLPTSILTVPATIIYFVSYDQLKSGLNHLSNSDATNAQGTRPAPWVSMVAGGTARMLSLTTVSPLELVRTKMQSEKMSYLQMNEAVESLIRWHGIAGLWKGIVPTLMRSVPFAGIYWVTYEKLKSFAGNANISFFHSFVAGTISGGIAATMTNPFDVVKTLYQTDFLNKHVHSGKNNKPTVLQTLKTVYASRGIAGLYSGLGPRLVKVIPQCAITVSTFEAGKSYFRNRNINRFLQSNEGNESVP